MIAITIARRPLSEPNVAANVLKHGCGSLNIKAGRIAAQDVADVKPFGGMPESKVDGAGFRRPWMDDPQSILDKQNAAIDRLKTLGRWPANLVLGHLTGCSRVGTPCAPGCPVAALDASVTPTKSTGGRIGNKAGGDIYGGGKGLVGDFAPGDPGYGDTGGPSRYFKVVQP